MSSFLKSDKSNLYAKELEGARLRGEWTSEAPSHLHGGQGKKIDWPELLRKYMKHNPDNVSTPSIASSEQQLRAALAAFYSEVGYSDASHSTDTASPIAGGRTLFPPVMPVDQNGIGWSGEGVSSQVERLHELSDSCRTSSDKRAVAAVQALALFSLGRDEDTVSLLHTAKFMEEEDAEATAEKLGSEDYSIALSLMGCVVYGMANERLHEETPTAGYKPFALAGYARAIDLHENVRGGKRANALRGLPVDEIERWGETALYRNALLGVRQGDFSVGMNALRAYQANSGRWPNDFREPQRNLILRVYLNVLNRSVQIGGYEAPPTLPSPSQDDWRSQAYQETVVATVASRIQIRDFEAERTPRDGTARRMLGADAKGVTSRTVSSRRPNPHLVLRPASATWSNEMLTTQRAAANAIQRSSEFPKAGKVNVPVIELADVLMEGWKLNGEQGGEYADEMVEILYKLSRLTFHSQRISRHLITALSAAQAYKEASRALTVYIQIVDKAREGDAASSAALVNESEKRAALPSSETNGNGAAHLNGGDHGEGISDAALEKAARMVGKDSDDDEVYILTLLFGARMLSKYLKDAAKADEVARKALDLIRSDKNKQLASKKSLVALTERVAGMTRADLAIQAADPARRPTLQAEALSLLKSSLSLDPLSSETCYHLSLLQASLRDVSSALVSARKALELEPADIQSWHLLTLLLSAQKDYKGALKIAEVALAQAEADDEADAQAAIKGVPPKSSRRKATPNGAVSNGSPSLGAETAQVRTQLLSVDFPPRGKERAESIIGLMMTHNSLEEIVEGGEAAIEGQREIFEFFHARISDTANVPQPSPGRSLPVEGTNKGTQSKLSVLLHAGHKDPNATSLSGMGQSGATLTRVQSTTSSLQSRPKVLGAGPSNAVKSSSPSAVSVPAVNATGEIAAKADATANHDAVRAAYLARREIDLLGSLWLMSAASFRRASKLDQCRVAIQEAEQLDAGNPDVWVQLALWFIETQDVSLAVNALYKALACDGSNVAASIHLARLFLSNPTLRPATSHDATASAVPRAGPQAHAMDGTRSRSIGATPKDSKSNSAYASTADAAVSDEAQDLSSVSLAEGLLTSSTNSNGWDSPEAWLFLGQVCQRTNRSERARECFKYALALEQSKPIRNLDLTLERCF